MQRHEANLDGPDERFRADLILRELDRYLFDQWPVDDDRLFARESFETMIVNGMRRENIRTGYIPTFSEPRFHETLRRFAFQNQSFRESQMRARVDAAAFRDAEERIAIVRREASEKAFEDGRIAERNSAAAYLELWAKTQGSFQPGITSGPVANSAAAKGDAARPLSWWFDKFLAERQEEEGNAKSRTEFGPVITYLIDFTGDCPCKNLSAERLESCFVSMVDIPGRRGIPKCSRDRLSDRSAYVVEHGWTGRDRLSISTLENNYRHKLSRFLQFLSDHGIELDRKPRFRLAKSKQSLLMAPLPRDNIKDDEIVKLLSAPLFTGCAGPERIWTPGPYLLQNDIYWGILVLITTGMRTGEPVRLPIDRLVEMEGHWMFDLRPYDPSKGRKAIGELMTGKTENASRVIPVSPLLVELGLIERTMNLKADGADRFLPSLEPYRKPDGTCEWGRAISRSLTYFMRSSGMKRVDLTAYSTRHTFSEQIEQRLSDRARKRVMGHALQKGSESYGSKTLLSADQIALVTAFGSPGFQEAAAVLLAAKGKLASGELKTWDP